jgi:signal peptidase II
MRRLVWLLLPLGVLAADLASKAWILSFLRQGESYPVIHGFFNLTLAFNRGAIFGSLSGLPDHIRMPLFLVAGLVALGYFGWIFLARETRTFDRVALGMVLGGALGNGADRWIRGYVVDFLDFVFGSWHYWTFNVADSFILVGFILYLFGLLRGHRVPGAEATGKP